MTRPLHDPYLTGQADFGGPGWVGSGDVQSLTGEVGSGEEVSKYHGSPLFLLPKRSVGNERHTCQRTI